MRHKTAELETTCRRLTRQTVSSQTLPDGEESGKGGLAPAPLSSRDCISDPHLPQHQTQAPPAGMLRFFMGGTNEEQCTWSLKASPHKLPITKGRITCKRKNLVGTTSTKKRWRVPPALAPREGSTRQMQCSCPNHAASRITGTPGTNPDRGGVCK